MECGLLIIMLTISSFFLKHSFFTPLSVRESIYRLLPQTTPENVNKNFSQYSLDPITRYPNVSLHFLKPSQVGPTKLSNQSGQGCSVFKLKIKLLVKQ